MNALLFSTLAAGAPYAVIVGTDTPPPGRTTLRYAASDARAVRDMLVDVGGHEETDVILLIDPTPDEILDVITAAPSDIDRFLFYYSGHADELALYPNGRRLPVGLLKDAVDRVDAELRVGVVDACRGGGWTGAKGVSPAESFEVGLTSAGTAYIAASSGAEDAHELETLGGSIFTHHWVSGLRGAADSDTDGVVTLGESFEWARAHTVRDSVLLAGHPQHPSFHFDVHGRSDLTLADLRGSRSAVTLRWGPGEVELFAIDTGIHVASLELQPASLVLPPGRYAVRRSSGGTLDAAEFSVEAGRQVTVAPEDFSALGPVGTVAMKGDAVAPIHRMTPHRGRTGTQFSFGSWVGPGEGGELQRHLLLRNVMQVGLTDRLSLSFPIPGLALSIGRPQHLEVMLFGGFYEGGLGLSWPEGDTLLGLYGDLGGGLDVRQPIKENSAIVSSMWAGSSTSLLLDNGGFGPSTIGFGLGAELHIAPRVTLRPSFGGEHIFGEQGRIIPTLGGSLRRGIRELPLIQVELSDTVSLDADFGLSFDPARLGAPVQETWIGLSTARGPKTPKRDR